MLNVCVDVVSQGLVVPVIRGAEAMNFADIEKTINELGEKVRDASVEMGRDAAARLKIHTVAVWLFCCKWNS